MARPAPRIEPKEEARGGGAADTRPATSRKRTRRRTRNGRPVDTEERRRAESRPAEQGDGRPAWAQPSGSGQGGPAWAQPVEREQGATGPAWAQPVARGAEQGQGDARPAWAKPVAREHEATGKEQGSGLPLGGTVGLPGGGGEAREQHAGLLTGAQGWFGREEEGAQGAAIFRRGDAPSVARGRTLSQPASGEGRDAAIARAAGGSELVQSLQRREAEQAGTRGAQRTQGSGEAAGGANWAELVAGQERASAPLAGNQRGEPPPLEEVLAKGVDQPVGDPIGQVPTPLEAGISARAGAVAPNFRTAAQGRDQAAAEQQGRPGMETESPRTAAGAPAWRMGTRDTGVGGRTDQAPALPVVAGREGAAQARVRTDAAVPAAAGGRGGGDDGDPPEGQAAGSPEGQGRYATQVVQASVGEGATGSGERTGRTRIRRRVQHGEEPQTAGAGEGALPPGGGRPSAPAGEPGEPHGEEGFLEPHGPAVFLSRRQITAGNVRTEAAAELLAYGLQTDFSEGVVDLGELQQLIDLRIVRARQHPTEELWVLNYIDNIRQKVGITEYLPLAELCRGLIIDRQGRIIARPFGHIEDLAISEELPPGRFAVADKVDGSLGITYWIGDTPYISTRGTFVDRRGTIGYATQTVQEYNQALQRQTAGFQFDSRYTYLWEVIEPENPHVVHYTERQVVLLAIRDTRTGQDMPLPQQSEVPFPIVPQDPGLQTMEQVREHVISHPETEGVVVLMEDGRRYRIKTDMWTLRDRLQRDIQAGVWQRTVWRDLFAGSSVDGVVNRTPRQSQAQVRDYATELVRRFDELDPERDREARWLEIRPVEEMQRESMQDVPVQVWQTAIWRRLHSGSSLDVIIAGFPEEGRETAQEYGEGLIRRHRAMRGSPEARWQWLRPNIEAERQALQADGELDWQTALWRGLSNGLRLRDTINDFPEPLRETVREYGEELRLQLEALIAEDPNIKYPWRRLRPIPPQGQ